MEGDVGRGGRFYCVALLTMASLLSTCEGCARYNGRLEGEVIDSPVEERQLETPSYDNGRERKMEKPAYEELERLKSCTNIC
ncbi:hypothetical protein CMI47_11900 [Candidatus Pacearchaeota archaeon]|nr:hypothetical protein [Candidatus Pacearchaeota archaeon]|tara:strand:+ start:1805 stop:2050 length:246 start_codon:yes stop_codon:yes gene_type:complete